MSGLGHILPRFTGLFALIASSAICASMLCINQSANASEINSALQEIRYGSTIELNNYLNGAADEFDDPLDAPHDETFSTLGQDEFKRKSPLKAALLSFVVPGLGQIYNGSHPAKIAAFPLIDAAAFYKYIDYRNQGNDKTAEFEAFANKYWSQEDYFDYIEKVMGEPDDLGYAHHLPDTKTQQYYEMIGKYDQFSYGWAAAEGDTANWDDSLTTYGTQAALEAQYGFDDHPYYSPLRLQYENMRDAANHYFTKRDRMLYVVAVNHLLSAVDAALAAVRHNNAAKEDAGFSVTPHLRMTPTLALESSVQFTFRF